MATTRHRRTRNPRCCQISNRQIHLVDSLQLAENAEGDTVLIAKNSGFSFLRFARIFGILLDKSAANRPAYFCVANDPCAKLRASRTLSGSRRCSS